MIQILEYINLCIIASFNAVFNYIITNRTYGKTWAMLIRSWRRAYKHGKKAIIVRLLAKEVKEFKNQLYKSKDLVKACKGIVPYDPETKKGNFRVNGKTCYIKRGGRWIWFLKVFACSDANAARAADDVDCDTIYFDEFMQTPENLARYRGDVVREFSDIFFSAKREHRVTAFLFGNREKVSNPFFEYFGIPPMPVGFEGVRRYRKKSHLVLYVNNEQKEKNAYDKAVRAAFENTAYGDFIYKNKAKTGNSFKRAKTPVKAALLLALEWKSTQIIISAYGGDLYVKRGSVASAPAVYCDTPPGRYKNEYKIVRSMKPLFRPIVNAAALNRIYFENEAAQEACMPFLQWIGITI